MSEQPKSPELDISKSELAVLNAIWMGHPCAASDIVERLNQHKQWHEKTVKTLLGRLVKKGAVDFHKENRRYLYFPLVERETLQQKESHKLLDRLFDGKVSPLVAAFASQRSLDHNDISELKEIIAQWEQEND